MVLLMDGLPLSYLIAMWSGMLSVMMACFAIVARYLHNDNVRAEKRFAKVLEASEGRTAKALEASEGRTAKALEELATAIKESEERFAKALKELEERLTKAMKELEERLTKAMKEVEERLETKIEAVDTARKEGDERLEKEINKNRVLINEVREGLARVGERLARLEGYVMQALPEPSDGDANDGDAKARELLEVVES